MKRALLISTFINLNAQVDINSDNSDPRPMEQHKPITVMYSYVDTGKYQALTVGLDYQYVRSHNTYKQMLFQTVWRAWELNCTEIDLAYTAELEKKKVGAKPIPTVAFIQVMDHFNHTVIASFAQSSQQHQAAQKTAA